MQGGFVVRPALYVIEDASEELFRTMEDLLGERLNGGRFVVFHVEHSVELRNL
jgi:hypothetical protein